MSSAVEPPSRAESRVSTGLVGIVLNPDVLAGYKAVDESLPALIVRAIDQQLEREYRYALGGQIVAGAGWLLVVSGFIYLVMQNHAAAAGSLLGTGVLGFLVAVMRTRLNRRN